MSHKRALTIATVGLLSGAAITIATHGLIEVDHDGGPPSDGQVTTPLGRQFDPDKIRQERLDLGIIKPEKVAERPSDAGEQPKTLKVRLPVGLDGSVDKMAAQEAARLLVEQAETEAEAEEAEVLMLMIAHLLDDD